MRRLHEVRRVAKAGQEARIRIADYHYRWSRTDTYNSARFVRLEEDQRAKYRSR